MGRKRAAGEGSVERLPSGSWRAVHSGRNPVTGERVRASRAFPTRGQALDWLRRQIVAGKPAPAGTVGQWLDAYLRLHRTRHAPGATRAARFSLDRWVRPHFGPAPMRDVTPLALEQWLAGLAEAGASRDALNRAGKAFRAALNAAVRADLIPTNPFARVKIPSAPKPATRSFTADELARLVAAADVKGGYYGAMMRTWAELGCRPGELYGLRWEDYDPAAGAVWVRRTVDPTSGVYREPKTPRVRPVPLSANTKGRLEAVRVGRTAGVMFGSPQADRPWWRGNFRDRVWVPLCRAAGVKASPNTVRHTCATLLLRASVSLRAVAERLGHSDPAMTLRKYAHALPDDQDRAAAAWAAILAGPVPRPSHEGENR
jgi:integrase